MSNWLDVKCPECGCADEIDVEAKVWVRLTNDGDDADEAENHDHDYDERSPASCGACNYSGRLSAFGY